MQAPQNKTISAAWEAAVMQNGRTSLQELVLPRL
jgi:hypothetical protein